MVHELVRCRHPSLEGEAAAGELLRAAEAGVPWSGMAVLMRDPARRGRSIRRALDRHHVPDEVAVTSMAGTGDRTWEVVVIAGCVEGELPHLPPRADDRADFERACARGTGTVIAMAATSPSAPVSRYVEGWPARAPRLPPLPAPPPHAPLAWTPGAAPVWPDGQLTLSATQLTTFEDCPLRYGFTYAVRVRGDAGPWARFGTLVHRVLAAFLDPDEPAPRTRARLREIADGMWSDDIARYRPQREEARRDLYALLDQWWDAEGAAPPDVIAVERAFDVEVGRHRVIGSIDRVERRGDGIEIVDYKTGRRKATQNEVADGLQLATYHLAAGRDPDLAAAGMPVRLRLLYLRTMEQREQVITADHDARTEARILDAAAGIAAETFSPSAAADCDHCDFHRLCPLQPEGREVGAP